MNIELLHSTILNDFPSGSAIEFYDGVLYLIGDDASKILLLNAAYKTIDAITIFETDEYRIPKKKKTDLEASAIIEYNQKMYLIVLGSASKGKREKMLLLSLDEADANKFEILETDTFIENLEHAGIEEVNIEGAATIGNKILLSNRGNKTHPNNFLIQTDANFFTHQNKAELNICELKINKDESMMAGISGLCYADYNDTLFFSASTEFTDNAIDDGKIGDSYLGIINNISTRLGEKIITPDAMLNLSKMNKAFDGEKIESVCIEQHDNNGIILHLVSDNDLGKTGLFKIKLVI